MPFVQDSDWASISIFVVPTSSAPAIQRDISYAVDTNTTLTNLDLDSFITYSGSNSLTITFNQPSEGTLSYNSGTGFYEYVADATYEGETAFTFEVSDGVNSTLVKATFFCQVRPVPGPSEPPDTVAGAAGNAVNRTSINYRSIIVGALTSFDFRLRGEVRAAPRAATGAFTITRNPAPDQIVVLFAGVTAASLNANEAAVAAATTAAIPLPAGTTLVGTVSASTVADVTWSSAPGVMRRVEAQVVMWIEVRYATVTGGVTTHFLFRTWVFSATHRICTF